MQTEFASVAGGSHEVPHWVEVIDAQGGFPTRWLGPYGSAQQAARAGRAVLRLLNPARYRAVVQAQPPGSAGVEAGSRPVERLDTSPRGAARRGAK